MLTNVCITGNCNIKVFFSNDGFRYKCPQISNVDNFEESDRIAIHEFAYH